MSSINRSRGSSSWPPVIVPVMPPLPPLVFFGEEPVPHRPESLAKAAVKVGKLVLHEPARAMKPGVEPPIVVRASHHGIDGARAGGVVDRPAEYGKQLHHAVGRHDVADEVFGVLAVHAAATDLDSVRAAWQAVLGGGHAGRATAIARQLPVLIGHAADAAAARPLVVLAGQTIEVAADDDLEALATALLGAIMTNPTLAGAAVREVVRSPAVRARLVDTSEWPYLKVAAQ